MIYGSIFDDSVISFRLLSLLLFCEINPNQAKNHKKNKIDEKIIIHMYLGFLDCNCIVLHFLSNGVGVFKNRSIIARVNSIIHTIANNHKRVNRPLGTYLNDFIIPIAAHNISAELHIKIIIILFHNLGSFTQSKLEYLIHNKIVHRVFHPKDKIKLIKAHI